MAKNTTIQSKRDPRQIATIKETADLAGVSTKSVRRVIKGDQKNDTVLSIFMTLDEKHDEVLAEVKNWTSLFNKTKKAV